MTQEHCGPAHLASMGCRGFLLPWPEAPRHCVPSWRDAEGDISREVDAGMRTVLTDQGFSFSS